MQFPMENLAFHRTYVILERMHLSVEIRKQLCATCNDFTCGAGQVYIWASWDSLEISLCSLCVDAHNRSFSPQPSRPGNSSSLLSTPPSYCPHSKTLICSHFQQNILLSLSFLSFFFICSSDMRSQIKLLESLILQEAAMKTGSALSGRRVLLHISHWWSDEQRHLHQSGPVRGRGREWWVVMLPLICWFAGLSVIESYSVSIYNLFQSLRSPSIQQI